VIIWALPELVLLLFYALQHGFERYIRRDSSAHYGAFAQTILLFCITTTVLNLMMISRFSANYYNDVRYGNEDNRGATDFVMQNMSKGDCVLVSGAASEQFDYYSRSLKWRPPCTWLSRWEWQCCSSGLQGRISIPGARSPNEELGTIISRMDGRTLWIFRRGEWPGLTAVMAQYGNAVTVRRPFGRVLIYRFQHIVQ